MTKLRMKLKVSTRKLYVTSIFIYPQYVSNLQMLWTRIAPFPYQCEAAGVLAMRS